MALQSSLSVIAIVLGLLLVAASLGAVRRQGGGAFALAVAMAASVAMEFCDFRALSSPDQWERWISWSLAAEGIAIPAWLVFALTFARKSSLKSVPPLPLLFLLLSPGFLLAGFFLPLADFYYSPDFAEEKILFLGRAGYLYSIALIVFLTYILLQLERTLAALPRQDRWRVKFEIVGAGALTALYLVYYSQGLLYRTINLDLLPARSAALALAAGLMIWSRLRRGSGTRIAVAPDVAFRSVVILAVSLYLLGLGVMGEGMRYMGDAFSRNVLLILALAGGVAMVAVFLSEAARRKLRVTLAKNFYKHKYEYREQWLAFTRSLNAARTAERLHKAILSFYAETFALRGGALWLREGEVMRPTAAHEWEMPTEIFRAGDPLVRSFGDKGWVFDARDDNPAVRAAHSSFLERYGVSFVVPLIFDDRPEGFIALGEPINKGEDFIYEDFDLMKMFAGHAAGAILSLRLAEQLAGARELAAVGRISAFVLHDLKNLVSGLGMMAENARDYIADPEFQSDLLEDLDGTVGKMKKLMTRLKDLEEKPALDLKECDLLEVAVEGIRSAANGRVEVRGEKVPVHADPVEMEKVVLNLVLNALQASGTHGEVAVEVGSADRAFLRVIDRGEGMDADFIRNRLFKPFETTKKSGFGIGLYQCRNIVEAHGGTIEVKSAPGEGAEFTVYLPSAAAGLSPRESFASGG